MPWKIVEHADRADAYCVHKETADGGAGEIVACHESREQANAHMKALYANEDSMTAHLFVGDENYVTVQPGEPYRLLPFGVIVKNGRRRAVTQEIAAQFRLPHFKPPIKLGSHDEPTPAGGHIIALEVRADGLYAIPEMNDRGAAALRDGAYRYHSPEIIWAGGGLEDPVTGETIPGPLIVGDALLHTPHLGEQAALYEANLLLKGDDPGMNEEKNEMIVMPQGVWQRFSAWLDKTFTGVEPEPEPEPEAEPEPQSEPEPEPQSVPEPMSADPQAEQYAALMAERDNLAAEVAEMKAQQAQAGRVAHYSAMLSGLPVNGGGEMLASMSDEQAAWVVEQFKALGAQIATNDKLTQVIGTEQQQPTDLHGVITAYQAAHKVSYLEAFEAVRAERPELFTNK